jgi:hypothetical protein
MKPFSKAYDHISNFDKFRLKGEIPLNFSFDKRFDKNI